MFDGILTVIGLAFLLFGLFVFFSAVLGLYRLDYVLNRMHAAAVGDALGIFCVLVVKMASSKSANPCIPAIIAATYCSRATGIFDPLNLRINMLSPSLS